MFRAVWSVFLLLLTQSNVQSSSNLMNNATVKATNDFFVPYTVQAVDASVLTDGNTETCHLETMSDNSPTTPHNRLHFFVLLDGCYDISNVTLEGRFYDSSAISLYAELCDSNSKRSSVTCKLRKRPKQCSNCLQNVTFVCNTAYIGKLSVRLIKSQFVATPFKLCEVDIKTTISARDKNVWKFQTSDTCQSSLLCGEGIRKQKASCFSSSNEPLSNDKCQLPKPDIRDAECVRPCQISISEWSPCSRCGCGIRKRSVRCRQRKTSGKWRNIDISACRKGKVPYAYSKKERNCTSSEPCFFYKHNEEMANCSSKCGDGTQKQFFQCYSLSGCAQTATAVDKSECQRNNAKPFEIKTRKCFNKCEFRVSSWNYFNCSAHVTSSRRTRERTVSCYRNAEKLDLGECKINSTIDIPKSEEPCPDEKQNATVIATTADESLSTSVSPYTTKFKEDGTLKTESTMSTPEKIFNQATVDQQVPVRATQPGDIWFSPSSQWKTVVANADIEEPKSSGNDGQIIGAAAGGVLCLVIVGIVLAAIFCVKRKSPKKEQLNLQPIVVETPADAQEFTSFSRERNYTFLPIAEEQTEASNYAKITAMKLSAFPDHVQRLQENGDAKLSEEFKSLEFVGKSQSSSIGEEKDNSYKNRYKNTIPYDEHRVVLKDLEGMEISETDYINASYIDGFKKPNRYVACQGPKSNTCADMWRMVWGESAGVVVMLCRFVENGRTRCERYWDDSQAKCYEGLRVEVKDLQRLATHTVRTITLALKKEVRTVKHYHFKCWPDHGVPSHPACLLGMIHQIRKEVGTRLLVVHCSAGVGRTGVFLAILAMMDRIDAERSLDVSGYVACMRTKRMEMIQTLGQYCFLYNVVLDYVICRQTGVSLKDFKKQLDCFHEPVQFRLPLELANQFELLEKVKAKYDESKYSAALSSVVKTQKNQSLDNLPPDATRVILRICGDSANPTSVNTQKGADYINASYIDGYYLCQAFIVTQHPIEDTMADFWKMVVQQGSTTIVNLTQPEEEKEYWPKLHSNSYGATAVELESSIDMPGYSARRLAIQRGTVSRKVVQFHYFDWLKNSISKRGLQNLISMMTEVNLWQKQNSNPPLIIHCSGLERCGAFCIARNVIDQMKNEGKIDILHMAKLANSQRPGLIQTLKCYQSIWLIVGQYILSKKKYENVKMWK